MKKISYIAAIAAVLSGCTDKDNAFSPAEPGQEVNFSVSLQESPSSRTIFGDETTINGKNVFPIYWVNGDQIIVSSPQANAGRNTAKYDVSVTAGDQNYADKITCSADQAAGVQWGESNVAKFYSIYPANYNADAVTVVNNTLTPADGTVKADLNIRNYQLNVFTKNSDGVYEGTPIDRKTMTNPQPFMCDAIMYAQTTADRTKSNDVILEFNPLATVLHVTIDGYTLAESLGSDPGVTIQDVMITAPAGINLAGNFSVRFDANAEAAPVIDASGNKLNNANVIHVPVLSTASDYLTITKDDKLTFDVFMIPQEGISLNENWTITISTSNGNVRRNLKPAANQNGTLAMGKVNKLPGVKFPVSNTFEFNNDSWIAQIPRNVYLSELSLPGAWYCYSSDYQATTNLATQYSQGIRAFHIDCRLTKPALTWPGDTKLYLSCAGTESTGMSYSGTLVVDALKNIAAQVAENEYAMAVLTIAEKERTSSGASYGTNDQTQVLEAIAGILNTANIPNLYTQTITPNTTVNDVLGKLIVKINTTNAAPYDGTIPSTVMSQASLASDAPFDRMNTSPMYWGADVINPAMNYYYMQAQRTYTTGSTSPQMTSREGAIDDIIAKSKSIYDQSEHNAWFQMGIGGYVKNGSRDTEDRATVASRLNTYLLGKINEKMNSNSSPVGIVLMNFATVNTQNGTTVSGTDLVNAIIKMNRMFILNRDPNQAEWPDGMPEAKNNVQVTPGGDAF